MTWGLTAEGFVIPTLTEIREEMNTAARNLFGNSIDVSDSDPLGQFIGILAERESLLWELAEVLYNGIDPNAATGAQLEALCALIGVFRREALGSIATLTLTGTAATVVNAGTRASVTGTGELFETLASATLEAVSAWQSATAYALGDRVTNDSNKVYQATAAGTSAGSGGPTGTGTAISDNTVTWAYVGAGPAAADVEAESVNTGPIVALARDIVTIETPVAGLSNVVNLTDATPGRDLETDEDLRIRRANTLATAGSSPVDALRADLASVDDVTAVTVFENDTNVTDADGVPPKSIECLVQGGTDADIAAQILASKAAGIGTHGTTTVAVDDSQGIEHLIKFSRPDEVEIYVIATVTYDADSYPADGDDQIAAAIIGLNGTQTGLDARASRIVSACFAVAGVLDVSVTLGTAPAPGSSTPVTITSRQLAVYDTSRITVNSSGGTP